MNKPENEEVNALPEWHEPFPKPNTIPSGWDLSESTAEPAASEPAEPADPQS